MPFDYQVLDVILPIPVESCSLWQRFWLNYPLLIHIKARLLAPLCRTRSFSELSRRVFRLVEAAGLDFWLFWQLATPTLSSSSNVLSCCSSRPTCASILSRFDCCCSITTCCWAMIFSRHFTNGVRSDSGISDREGGSCIFLLDHICVLSRNPFSSPLENFILLHTSTSLTSSY